MRVHLVGKARKQHYCSYCREPIMPGQSYYWWKHRNQPKTNRHEYHGHPQPKHLTTSDKLYTLYDAQDRINEALARLGDVDFYIEDNGDAEDYTMMVEAVWNESADIIVDLQQVIEEVVDECMDVADQYREGADAIRDYFGDTDQTDEMDEKAEAIEEWCNNFDSIDWELPSQYENEMEEFVESLIGDVESNQLELP